MPSAINKLPLSRETTDPTAGTAWVQITGRAIEGQGTGARTVATYRKVIKFDSSGGMKLHHAATWRPFFPDATTQRVYTVSLYQVGKVLDRIELDDALWRRVESYGLNAFLLDAAASHSFKPVLLHVQQTVPARKISGVA